MTLTNLPREAHFDGWVCSQCWKRRGTWRENCCYRIICEMCHQLIACQPPISAEQMERDFLRTVDEWESEVAT